MLALRKSSQKVSRGEKAHSGTPADVNVPSQCLLELRAWLDDIISTLCHLFFHVEPQQRECGDTLICLGLSMGNSNWLSGGASPADFWWTFWVLNWIFCFFLSFYPSTSFFLSIYFYLLWLAIYLMNSFKTQSIPCREHYLDYTAACFRHSMQNGNGGQYNLHKVHKRAYGVLLIQNILMAK